MVAEINLCGDLADLARSWTSACFRDSVGWSDELQAKRVCLRLCSGNDFNVGQP